MGQQGSHALTLGQAAAGMSEWAGWGLWQAGGRGHRAPAADAPVSECRGLDFFKRNSSFEFLCQAFSFLPWALGEKTFKHPIPLIT